MADRFAPMAEPPYYAVIFTNQHKVMDNAEYGRMAEEMERMASEMPGYIGFEAARDAEGFGFAISYWQSEDAILNWKKQVEHLAAQHRGRNEWYSDYTVRVAKVERVYSMKTSKLKNDGPGQEK